MTICIDCGTTKILYVSSCSDSGVGDSKVLVWGWPDAVDINAEEALIADHFKAVEDARRTEDPDSIAAAQDALATLLKEHIPQTSDARPSQHLVQAFDIIGKKWTYIRSDKMRNHWRSYDVDKSLLEARTVGAANDPKQLERGRLASAWDEVSQKLTDDLRQGFRGPDGKGELLKGSVSGSITDLWKNNWTSWVDAVNDSLLYSKAGANYDLSAAAQVFRGYAGFDVVLGYNPNTGTYGLSASGNARAVLAEAKADLTGYLPDRDGWHALIEWAEGNPSQAGSAQQLDFGYFRFRAQIGVDAMVGASIMGTVGVEYVPKTDGKVSGKGSSAGGKGEIAAGAFAGAEASAEVKGGLEWDNPEKRASNGGQHGWATVFEVGVQIAANAGIGAEAHFKIELDSSTGKLYARCGAQLVIGVGAKGGVTAAVGLNTAFDFVVYVYHQLVANDFSLLSFISRSAFEAIKALAYYLIVKPAQYVIGELGDLVQAAITSVSRMFTGAQEAEDFARRIQARPDMLTFAPPETKGMILYRLGETFTFSREEYQEGAILVVMDTIQSRREWEQVIERVTINGARSSKAQGMARMNGVLDWGSQTKFNQKVLEIESQREIAPDTPTRYYA
ncbi:hypothetical protein [Litoreibacter janthinus]|uniref:Uncharacterized protein n=1 Tax=Litoreibacter janthinus TaxID=670154 RepID=A0A1I6IET4_9RHOB|nr:hypothetical protein [Litoreibacter janthinus]SFR65242.1 hypothetical protein SAMN04488002_3764 [Litoreibacter janthinus]